jgi:hypothetical protein
VGSDPAKLSSSMPNLKWDGQKRSYPNFNRRVLQNALAMNFKLLLDLPKDESIAAMALRLTPPPGGHEVKEPSDEAVAEATAWHVHASPIVAGWLEGAVPESYQNLLLNAPMGSAFDTWNMIVNKAVSTSKREVRHYKRVLHSTRMQSGMSFEKFVSELDLARSVLLGSGHDVPDEDMLDVLYEGVTSQYLMARTVLEANEATTYKSAVTAFTAVADDISRRRAHQQAHNEKAHNVHAATGN